MVLDKEIEINVLQQQGYQRDREGKTMKNYVVLEIIKN